ncbi:MAG: 50S ribosomal protein L5 [Parcubacteria group bacterium]|nr:50S ribosomal protein L5 [Parcubacteria group bacterium]MBI3074774.1 50S ribosomal protein L5 [Parcubacteria group bacterium]
METTKTKQKKAYKTLKTQLGFKSPMEAIRVLKVIVNSGTGKLSRLDKKKNEFVAERLGKLAGQKAAPRAAKISIASFKVREGDVIGQIVTLRGARMYDFLDRLLNIAIPRIRDFRGFSPTSVDAMGNLTIGIREHNIFPETADEELKDVFGLSVTIVTNAKKREDAVAFFRELGVPFKKVNKE